MAGIRIKKWKNKRGTIKSCYEITYYINGKQCRKSGYATKQQAQEDLLRVTNSYSSNNTVGEIADGYINTCCKLHCKQNTIDLYKCYEKTLDYFYSNKIKNVTKQDIQALQLSLVNKGYSKRYVNKLIDFIKMVFKYATECKFISENVASSIKRITIEKERVSFLDTIEVLYFLDAVKLIAPQYYPFLYTALYTGMRRGELLGLEWKNINLKNKQIEVVQQIYNGKIQTLKTKKSRRTIDMPNNLVNYLKEYKANSSILSSFVFTDDYGRPINRNTLKHHWERIRLHLSSKYPENEVFNNLHLHDLRHTYASILLNNGAPINFVQEQLGHSSAKMTLDTYAHCLPSKKQDFVNCLEKIESEHFVSIENTEAI